MSTATRVLLIVSLVLLATVFAVGGLFIQQSQHYASDQSLYAKQANDNERLSEEVEDLAFQRDMLEADLALMESEIELYKASVQSNASNVMMDLKSDIQARDETIHSLQSHLAQLVDAYERLMARFVTIQDENSGLPGQSVNERLEAQDNHILLLTERLAAFAREKSELETDLVQVFAREERVIYEVRRVTRLLHTSEAARETLAQELAALRAAQGE